MHSDTNMTEGSGCRQCDKLENEIERLQKLHLDRTKLTTKVIEERDSALLKLHQIRDMARNALSDQYDSNDIRAMHSALRNIEDTAK